MHGFIIADDKNVPQTNYISWRDHRSQVPDAYGQTSFEILQHALAKHLQQQTFRSITGMRLRPSLPIANFFDWVRENRPKGPLRLLTIPDWLACCSGRATGFSHSSMLAGLGLWNIRTQKCDAKLISLFEETFGVVPLLNKAAQTNDVAGFWVAGEQSIPIYVGVGDHQCALLGADNQKNSLSFNIGTGSQVSRIVQTLDDNEDSEVENRPFFGKEFLRTITHIPGGRVLALFVSLLQNPHHEMPDEIWKLLGELSLDEVLNSKLTMNLSFFPGSWRYNETGGSIGNITEHSWNYRSYLASLLRCFAVQYVQASRLVVPNQENVIEIILSGGVPRKIPVLGRVFEKHLGIPVTLTGDADETLTGLKKLAEQSFQIDYDPSGA